MGKINVASILNLCQREMLKLPSGIKTNFFPSIISLVRRLKITVAQDTNLLWHHPTICHLGQSRTVANISSGLYLQHKHCICMFTSDLLQTLLSVTKVLCCVFGFWPLNALISQMNFLDCISLSNTSTTTNTAAPYTVLIVWTPYLQLNQSHNKTTLHFYV